MRIKRTSKTKIPTDTADLHSTEVNALLPEIHWMAKLEYKANRPSLSRRIGQAALTGAAFGIGLAETAILMAKDSTRTRLTHPRTHRPPRKELANLPPESSQYSRLGRWALNYFDKRITSRELARQTANEKAIGKFHDAHPEIRAREYKGAVNIVKESVRREVGISRVQIVAGIADKDADHFSWSIPPRQRRGGNKGPVYKGSYPGLAGKTLGHILESNEREGSTVSVLGSSVEKRQFENLGKRSHGVEAAGAKIAEYNAGVGTLLWQMGVVQFDTEQDIANGKGKFNDDIQWDKTDQAITAYLPFDPTNELHVMLGEAMAPAVDRQFIEIQIRKDESDGYGAMSMGVSSEIPAMAGVAA
jgi:hypothetical protein